MIDALGRKWLQTILRCYPSIFPDGPRKIMKTLVGKASIQAMILT